jgi:hypothetical protein
MNNEQDTLFSKSDPVVWCVFGVRYQGRMSVFPDDYDFVGYCTSESESKELCDRLNGGETVENDESDDDYESDDEDEDEDDYKYEYMDFQKLTLKK